MPQLIDQAVAAVGNLSHADQDAIAAIIFDALEDNRQWILFIC